MHIKRINQASKLLNPGGTNVSKKQNGGLAS